MKHTDNSPTNAVAEKLPEKDKDILSDKLYDVVVKQQQIKREYAAMRPIVVIVRVNKSYITILDDAETLASAGCATLSEIDYEGMIIPIAFFSAEKFREKYQDFNFNTHFTHI